VGFWGAKFTKMGDSLPSTPINHHAKFEFILGGEILNRTNHTTLQTNKQTNKQTVTRAIDPQFAYRHVWIIMESFMC